MHMWCVCVGGLVDIVCHSLLRAACHCCVVLGEWEERRRAEQRKSDFALVSARRIGRRHSTNKTNVRDCRHECDVVDVRVAKFRKQNVTNERKWKFEIMSNWHYLVFPNRFVQVDTTPNGHEQRVHDGQQGESGMLNIGLLPILNRKEKWKAKANIMNRKMRGKRWEKTENKQRKKKKRQILL